MIILLLLLLSTLPVRHWRARAYTKGGLLLIPAGQLNFQSSLNYMSDPTLTVIVLSLAFEIGMSFCSVYLPRFLIFLVKVYDNSLRARKSVNKIMSS